MASISGWERCSGRALGTSRTGRQNPTSPGSSNEDEARTGIGPGQDAGAAESTMELTLAQRTIQRRTTAAQPTAQTAARIWAGST